MINFIIAHSEEIHTSSIETTVHDMSWFVQIPLYVIAISGFVFIIWTITKKLNTTILLTATLLLISGIALIAIAPLVSALAITVGLVASLLVTLLGLGNGAK